MKKILSLGLVLALSLTVLASCANNKDDQTGTSGSASAGTAATANVNLEEFYQTIFTDPENTPAMVVMEGEAIDGFYPGLTAVERKQTVAYMPMMTAVPCEIMMVECASEADVDTVKEIFQARINTQVNDHLNYPAVIEAWEKEAQVVVNGNYVALFVINGMTEQTVENFNAAFAG